MKGEGNLTVVFCLFLAALLFLSASARNVQAEENGADSAVKNETGWRSAAAKFSREKAEFEKDARRKIAGLDEKIDELEGKAKVSGAKMKSEAEKGLRELKKKRAALKKDMKRLHASGRKAWEKAKQKVNDAMNDLQKTYDRVVSHFESD